MKHLVRKILFVASVAILSSCASIVSKSNWPLTVNTNPQGAKVEITDRHGYIVYNGTSPATVTLKSSSGFFTKQSYRVKLSMPGFAERIIPVECELNGWYIGNVVFGGFIGWLIVDPATGAMYRLDREYINETLDKSTASNQPTLQILDINDVPQSMREHLVCLK